jgi:putative transposase
MMWNLPPPPGFQGLDPEKPVMSYVRRLPHWRQNGASYFVTFRQRDSLPHTKLLELEMLRHEWQRRHPPPQTKKQLEQLAHTAMTHVEAWLDQSNGSCLLKEPIAAKMVVDAMRSFDGQWYELGCYVVMPNHVHGIVRPLLCNVYPLERILQSWKRHAALGINRHCRLIGPFWQEESFDRIIRDEDHLYRAVQYIGANPAKAGLRLNECPRWVRPEWETLGWTFEKPR